jgi:hypothetical protein
VQFGDDFAIPIVGNFDPPSSLAQLTNRSWTNPSNPRDVNDDGFVSPIDPLLVINDLNEKGARPLTGYAEGMPHLDVNADQFVTPMDALIILNELNGMRPANVRSAAAIVALPLVEAASAVLADAAFAEGEVASEDADSIQKTVNATDAAKGGEDRAEQRMESQRWADQLDAAMIRWQQNFASVVRESASSTADPSRTASFQISEWGPFAP